MQDILVQTLMSQHIIELPCNRDMRTILRQMTETNHSCVVITDNHIPVGIITERDIVRVLQQSEPSSDIFALTANEVMSSPIISLNQGQSLFDALVIARANNIRHFPVVDDHEQLVGLVTNSDLANAHFHMVEIRSEMIEKSVQMKTRELLDANEELLALSMEDHLLEIGNRRAMEVDLEHTHAAALRYRQIYSVILMDLDYFKAYNDHFGHDAGDKALQAVAAYIKSNMRRSDRLYRYGGEEILLLLPSTDIGQAQILADNLVNGLMQEAIPHSASPLKVLTVSAGLACVCDNGAIHKTWKDTVKQADQALYIAKNKGRNRAEAARNEKARMVQKLAG